MALTYIVPIPIIYRVSLALSCFQGRT